MKYIYVIALLFLFLIAFVSIQIIKQNIKPVFQGPIPQGYDETYFRKTGITKPLK